MASISSSASGDHPLIEPTNVSHPSTSVKSSYKLLFSSIFDCLPFLSSFCGTGSPNISVFVTPVTNVFEEVAPISPTKKTPREKLPYDVFINNRGMDSKETLANPIYNTLIGMGFRVFLDSQELELREFFPAALKVAMESAKLHIAIISENYAQSPWCLAELSFMLKTGTQIIPVFYHVQPEDVRYAKGAFAEAFCRHEEKGRYSTEKLQEWMNALHEVSYYVGHVINIKDDEAKLLKNIVNRVWKVKSTETGSIPISLPREIDGRRNDLEEKAQSASQLEPSQQ